MKFFSQSLSLNFDFFFFQTKQFDGDIAKITYDSEIISNAAIPIQKIENVDLTKLKGKFEREKKIDSGFSH